MIIRCATLLGLAGLMLMTGAAFAAETAPCRETSSVKSAAPQDSHVRGAATSLIDGHAGTAMRVSRLQSGAFQIDIDGENLEVRKILHENGDFDLALRAGQDLLTVVGRGAQLRVARRGQTIDLDTAAPAEGDLDRLQELLAGSAAIRRFRGMRSMLASSTRSTALGRSVDIIDMMVGALKGEAPTPGPALATPVASIMAGDDAVAETDGTSCYEAWVGEVVAAWAEYEGCVNTFAWYNPLREVCAFAWVIRVESAWFRLIGCSSFPLKLEACDVASDIGVR